MSTTIEGTELQPLRRDPEAPEKAQEPEEEEPPKDTLSLVFLIIMLNGVGALMPWNMLITISYDYYESYKMLANATIDPQTGLVHGSPTFYSENFQSFQTVCSQVPNLLLNVINIFLTTSGSLAFRIRCGLLGVIICVISVLAMIYVDTNSWLPGFFTLTIATIILLNAANGVYQNSIFGLASDLPPKYTNAVIIGNNACGTFITILSMGTKAFTRNILNRAFVYFLIALGTVVLCLFSFSLLQRLRYFQFYSSRAQKRRDAVTQTSSNKFDIQLYVATFREARSQLVNVFLVFFATLSVFPGVMMYVKKSSDSSFPVPDAYFMDVTTFLQFNVFAFLGSAIAGKYTWVSPKKLWIPVYLRLLFIPFFAMCNFLPDARSVPVWFPNTWLFVLAGAVLSFSSGYLSSLGMMYTCQTVHPARAQTAGMMAALALILGIVLGLCATMVIKAVITI